MTCVPSSFVKRSYEPLLQIHQEIKEAKQTNKQTNILPPQSLTFFTAEYLLEFSRTLCDVLWQMVCLLRNAVPLSSSQRAPSLQILLNYFDSTTNPGCSALLLSKFPFFSRLPALQGKRTRVSQVLSRAHIFFCSK